MHGNHRNGVIIAALIGAAGVIVAAFIQRTPPSGNFTRPFLTGASQVSTTEPVLPQSIANPPFADTLSLRAEEGDREAQFQLAQTYYNGQGVTRNLSRASYWYRQAAVAGHTAAQTQLGWMYTRGIGTATDRKEAARWFKLASEAGDPRAQNYLGWAYVQGWGVPTDYALARYWLEKSAAANDRIGLYNYGVLHERGFGAPADIDTAIELYRRSASAGYAGAREALQRLHAE